MVLDPYVSPEESDLGENIQLLAWEMTFLEILGVSWCLIF